MSALSFLLMLLIFITIPSLLYTIFYILKCPPNTFLLSPADPPSPRAALPAGKKAAFDRMELITVVVVAKSEDAKEECPVCLSPFEGGEELWQLSLCKHLFHAPCIQRWLHARSSCPVCRAFLVTPKAPPPRKAIGEDDLWQGLPDSAGMV